MLLTAAQAATQLLKAADDVEKRASVAVRKVAFDIEADAKTLVPVDTGNLKNSISTTIANDGLSAQVGPEANYGAHLEAGTYKMAAQPYMTPAAERHTDAFVQALSQVIDL